MSYNTNNYNKNTILNLTPRTHISVESKSISNEKISNIKLKKYDSVEIGLKKLIILGKIIKNYIPKKNTVSHKKNFLEMKKSASNKKLTPFQIYLKNKKLNFEKLNQKKNFFDINLRTFNSEKNINKKKIPKIFIIKNSNSSNNNIKLTSPNKYKCNFKNKFIKSIFEKSDLNNQNYMKIKTISVNKNKNKKNFDKDNLLYIKDKIFLLNKNKKFKKKQKKNLFKEIKIKNNNLNNINAKTMTEENNNKNIDHRIPLINFRNTDFILNQNFCDTTIKKNFASSILFSKLNNKRNFFE